MIVSEEWRIEKVNETLSQIQLSFIHEGVLFLSKKGSGTASDVVFLKKIIWPSFIIHQELDGK